MTKSNKGKKGGNNIKSVKLPKHQLERKRDERARRNALKKEREAKEYLENDENFVSFSNQLKVIGYKIKDIKGDGNCLFRALADQLDGSDDDHLRHRKIVVKYLADHRDQFEPFVEDDRSFDEHVKELGNAGTYGGNDSIVAFSRCYGVNIVIHQLNERCWVIEGDKYRKPDDPKRDLHISYHNGDHYSSVRRIGDPINGPAWMYNNKEKKKETCDLDKNKLASKKAKMKFSTSPDLETVHDESSDVAIIQAATACQNLELIQQSLIENSYDIDASIRHILQLQSFQDRDVNDAEDTACSSVMTNLEIQEKSKESRSTNTSRKACEYVGKNNERHIVKRHKKVAPSNWKRKQVKKTKRMEEKRKELKNKELSNNDDTQSSVATEFVGLEALAI